MPNCFYCEGGYLHPNQRHKPNPKYGLHQNCMREMIRANEEVEAVLDYLQKHHDNQLLTDALQRIKDFHERMQKVRKFQESLRDNEVPSINTKSKDTP